MTAPLLILCNAPDQACAQRIAAHLLEHRLAACVNLLAPCQSVYRWQGAIEQTTEVPMLIKTQATRYAEVEAAVRGLHPYDVPEIIAIPIGAGLPAYLDWLNTETDTP